MNRTYLLRPCCFLKIRAQQRGWRASWHPIWPNWLTLAFIILAFIVLRFLRSFLVSIALIIFAVDFFRHILLQLIGQCISFFLLIIKTLVLCHWTKSQSLSSQNCWMNKVSSASPSSGRFFSMSIVTPDVPSALLFFIFFRASLTSASVGALFRWWLLVGQFGQLLLGLFWHFCWRHCGNISLGFWHSQCCPWQSFLCY